MRTSVKFLCVSLLLCLALVCMLFSAVGTLRAYQQLQQKHQRVLVGDVTTIDSWMTLPYIARVYHVPEACLYPSLHLPSSWLVRHSTLRTIADHYKRPVTRVIHDVQQAILNYRQHRNACEAPASPTPSASPVPHKGLPAVARKGSLDE